MSADLELRQEIQLPTIKIISSSSADANNSATKVDQEDEEECRTPRSPRSSIPEALVCPPAPRKPRRPVTACKRKLSELKFFEMVAGEEIESFFSAAKASKIRRCLV